MEFLLILDKYIYFIGIKNTFDNLLSLLIGKKVLFFSVSYYLPFVVSMSSTI